MTWTANGLGLVTLSQIPITLKYPCLSSPTTYMFFHKTNPKLNTDVLTLNHLCTNMP